MSIYNEAEQQSISARYQNKATKSTLYFIPKTLGVWPPSKYSLHNFTNITNSMSCICTMLYIIFLELFQYYHYSAINILKIWEDLFQDCLISQKKALQPFKTSYLFTTHVGVCILGYLNPKILCVHCLLARIKCIQKTHLILRKQIIRLCTTRLTFSVGPYFTT